MAIRPVLIFLLALTLPAGCRNREPRPLISDTRASAAPAESMHRAARSDANPAKPTAKTRLLPGLGHLSYPVSTRVPQAQAYFDQGLRLAYAYNHDEASRSFRQAQGLDPGCALCFWGEALVLGSHINAPMAAEAIPPALEALAKAQAASAGANARERALIEALGRRYGTDPAGQPARDRAYAEAMGEVAARYPEDDDIAVLYAEALMDLSPWDYWEDGGTRPKGHTPELLQVLERVLARHPEHPGANHFLIHAVEASSEPERAVPAAERLGGLMPGAGHLVHMPSHIWFRLGRYRDAMAANEAAIAADQAYFRLVGRRPGIYGDGYYPHNVHFLMASAQMVGAGSEALAAAAELTAWKFPENLPPWIQTIQAAPYFAHAQYGDAASILALPEPSPPLPYVAAARHYARGLARLWRSETAEAELELAAIGRLRRDTDWSPLTAAGVPAPEVLALAENLLRAREAQSARDLRRAERQLEAAVAIQERLPYMEPPYWYYPVRQSLGVIRLQQGRMAEAAADFAAALRATPNNPWALRGLAEAGAE